MDDDAVALNLDIYKAVGLMGHKKGSGEPSDGKDLVFRKYIPEAICCSKPQELESYRLGRRHRGDPGPRLALMLHDRSTSRLRSAKQYVTRSRMQSWVKLKTVQLCWTSTVSVIAGRPYRRRLALRTPTCELTPESWTSNLGGFACRKYSRLSSKVSSRFTATASAATVR